MNKKRLYIFLLATFLSMSVWILPATAQNSGDYPLGLCEKGAFSTETAFVSHNTETYDGNPNISDGDLLSLDYQLCARNTDLIRIFEINDVDLGLDAVDILDFENRIVAFSTELDGPNGIFSDGDVLTTNGAVIPNYALLAGFAENYGQPIDHNLGLDAIHFIGAPERILEFIALAHDTDPNDWGELALQARLDEFQIDIWFSIEGNWTLPNEELSPLLDGDMFSARDGSIVSPHRELLASVELPEEIPDTDMDLGLDSLTATREENNTLIFFSTEVFFEYERSITDGDVLWYGGDVLIDHATLLLPFEPPTDFVGLDALWMPLYGPSSEPNIQSMCGREHLLADFDGGMVIPGGSGTGLYWENESFQRPCGRYVPIDGFLPADGDIERFRVAFRLADDPVPPIGTALGIQTHWEIEEWGPRGCAYYGGELSTDENGWMNANEYLAAKNGQCAQSDLQLAVWNTRELGEEPGPNSHYVLWLEWEDSAGELHQEPFEHHLQLDNLLPIIDSLQLRLPEDSGEPVVIPVGGEAPEGNRLFKVWGQFSDDNFQQFRMVLRGGDPPIEFWYDPVTHYNDLEDNVDETGTMSDDDTPVYLADIDMEANIQSFAVPCCYFLHFFVYDAAIRHDFDRQSVQFLEYSSSHIFTTFSVAPIGEPEATPEPAD